MSNTTYSWMPKVSKGTKKVAAKDLKVDRAFNIREEYDVEGMQDQILAAKAVIEPIWVEEGTNLVLRGNRRTLAVQDLLEREDTPHEVYTNIEKLDVKFVKDLTDNERTEIMLDHGSQKGLTKCEIVKAVWRLQDQGYSEKDIILILWQQLGVFTGNEAKAKENMSIPNEHERNKKLKTQFHGTVGNYLMNANYLGDKIKENLLLGVASGYRKLTEEEVQKYEFPVNRDAVAALKKAKDADGKEWHPINGGPEFNKVYETLKANNGKLKGKTGDEPKPLEKKVVKELASSSKSNAIRNALAAVTGEAPEGYVVADADNELFRIQMNFEEITKKLDSVADAKVKELLTAILYKDHGTVTDALKPFCKK